MRMKIWITGASGMLAKDLSSLVAQAGHVCFGTDLDVDITDQAAVSVWLDANPVDWVINCAAYTAVDKAESDEDKAFAINATGPANLALETAARHIPLIHISTDYVLNGAAPNAMNESAALDPQNAYGRTKAKGEVRVQALNPEHWIIRTAWLYGIHGNNFVKTMLRLMGERDLLRVVNDQWGSPTWTVDLCKAILQIITERKNPGVYHFSDEGCISWCDFAQEIQTQGLALGLLQRKASVEGVPSSEYPTPATRPAWSVLDKTQIKTLGVAVPDWKNSLASYLQLEVNARA
jgi:dTDP-4-dehydrorhamnose reductase